MLLFVSLLTLPFIQWSKRYWPGAFCEPGATSDTEAPALLPRCLLSGFSLTLSPASPGGLPCGHGRVLHPFFGSTVSFASWVGPSILQALQNEVVSQASLYSNLLQLKEALFSVASKEDVAVMKLQLEQLDERWGDLPQIISKRLVPHRRAPNNVPMTTRLNPVFRFELI